MCANCTQDLISYKILSVNPLQVEECAKGTGRLGAARTVRLFTKTSVGDLCGSIFLDAAFENYVKLTVGEPQYEKLREKAKKKMIKEFENTVKRSYTGEDKEYSVKLLGVADNAEFGINDDIISLRS
jgi:hypothetical protein